MTVCCVYTVMRATLLLMPCVKMDQGSHIGGACILHQQVPKGTSKMNVLFVLSSSSSSRLLRATTCAIADDLLRAVCSPSAPTRKLKPLVIKAASWTYFTSS